MVVGISNGNAIVLKEGSNINLGVSGDTITVTASGGSGDGGETNVGVNLGAGSQVFKEKSDTTFNFRTLVAGGIVSLSQGASDITISATEVDGSVTNEIQEIDSLYLSGTTLHASLSMDGVPTKTVDLASINTDAQGFTVSDVGSTYTFDLSGTSSDFALIAGSGIGLSRSGNNVTIAASGSGYGSGTTGRIAAWSSDSLRSHNWEITDTYIRHTSTGAPEIGSTTGYVFRGDTNTGLIRSGTGQFALRAGSANALLQSTALGLDIDLNKDGTIDSRWGSGSLQVGINVGTPMLQTTGRHYTWTGYTNSGIAAPANGVMSFFGGNATNPIFKSDGVALNVVFDPNMDGTNDVTISASQVTMTPGLTVTGASTFNGGVNIPAHSTFDTKTIAGFDSLNNVSKVVLRDGFAYSRGSVVDTVDVVVTPSSWAWRQFNGARELTSTTEVNLPWTSSTVIASGGITAPTDSVFFEVDFTGHVEIGLNGSIQAEAGAYSGSVTFFIYKNSSYDNSFAMVGQWASNEAKMVHHQHIMAVAPGDKIKYTYQLGSAGTMQFKSPSFKVKRL